MKSSIISFALTAAAAASVATGSPLSNYKRALKTYTSDVQIHESCNATQREYLTEALADVVNITTWARNCEQGGHCCGKTAHLAIFLPYAHG